MGVPKLSLLEKARLTIKSDYAYGDRPLPKIPPKSDLVFEVELIGIKRNGVELKPQSWGTGQKKRQNKEGQAEKSTEDQKSPEKAEQAAPDSGKMTEVEAEEIE